MLAIPVKCMLEVAYLYIYIELLCQCLTPVMLMVAVVMCLLLLWWKSLSGPKLTHCTPDLLVSLEAQAIRGKDGQNRPALSQQLIPH